MTVLDVDITVLGKTMHFDSITFNGDFYYDENTFATRSPFDLSIKGVKVLDKESVYGGTHTATAKAYWSEKGWTIDGPLGLRIQGSRIAFHENGTISHNFQPNGAVGFIFRPILKGTSGLLIRQFSSDASFTGFFDGLQGRLQKAQQHEIRFSD